MESKRTWSDERMDEFAARTEESFKDVRAERGTGFVGAVVSHFLG